MKKNRFDTVISFYAFIVLLLILAQALYRGGTLYTLRKTALNNIELTSQEIASTTKVAFDHSGQADTTQLNLLLKKHPNISSLTAYWDGRKLFETVDNNKEESNLLATTKSLSFLDPLFSKEVTLQLTDNLGRPLTLEYTTRLVSNRAIATFIEDNLLVILVLLAVTILFSVIILLVQYLSRSKKKKEPVSNLARQPEVKGHSKEEPITFEGEELINFSNNKMIEEDADSEVDFNLEHLPKVEGLEDPLDIDFSSLNDLDNESDDEVITFNTSGVSNGDNDDDYEALELPSLADDELSLPPLDDDFALPALDDDLLSLSDDNLLPSEENVDALDELMKEEIELDTLDGDPALDELLQDEDFLADYPTEEELEVVQEPQLTDAAAINQLDNILQKNNKEDVSVICIQQTNEMLGLKGAIAGFWSLHNGVSIEPLSSGYAIIVEEKAEAEVRSLAIQLLKWLKELDYQVTAGMSSKQGRLIRAKLLLREAKMALQQAEQASEGTLQLFKPDVEQYRHIFYVNGS